MYVCNVHVSALLAIILKCMVVWVHTLSGIPAQPGTQKVSRRFVHAEHEPSKCSRFMEEAGCTTVVHTGSWKDMTLLRILHACDS